MKNLNLKEIWRDVIKYNLRDSQKSIFVSTIKKPLQSNGKEQKQFKRK